MQTKVPATVNESTQLASARAKNARVATENMSFVDNRPIAITQRKLHETIEGSVRVQQQKMLMTAINDSHRIVSQRQMAAASFGNAIQRKADPQESSPQDSLSPLQRTEIGNSKVLQEKPTASESAKPAPKSVASPNKTGLPDQLKSGIESLSGMSMDHVKVHYNSSQPAQLSALAYAQGADIHVAPGQEQHLPHEAWHVVQQAQGRVKPTMQMKGGIAVNDDKGLEHEADVMGAKASQLKYTQEAKTPGTTSGASLPEVVQAKWIDVNEKVMMWDVPRGGLQWYFQKETNLMTFKIVETIEDEDIRKTLEEMLGKEYSYERWMKEWGDYGWIDPSPEHKDLFATYINRIISNYPLDSHIYVGIGASCDLVLEYIKLKYPKAVSVSIPISAANASPNEDGSGEWTKKQLERLHKYIYRSVGPDAINATSKKLLVMDVTSGGSSLKNICDALETILRIEDKGPERVQRLSLNTTVPANRKLKKPKAEKELSEVPLLEKDMEERGFTKEEAQTGVVKRGGRWIGHTEFDDDGSDDEDGNSKSHLEYEPSEYDSFIEGPESAIGEKLDNMDYKKLGRIYDKIPMKDVMKGTKKNPEKRYNKKGHANIKRYAAKLLEE